MHGSTRAGANFEVRGVLTKLQEVALFNNRRTSMTCVPPFRYISLENGFFATCFAVF